MTIDRGELVGAEVESVERLEQFLELCHRAGADKRGVTRGSRRTHAIAICASDWPRP